MDNNENRVSRVVALIIACGIALAAIVVLTALTFHPKIKFDIREIFVEFPSRILFDKSYDELKFDATKLLGSEVEDGGISNIYFVPRDGLLQDCQAIGNPEKPIQNVSVSGIQIGKIQTNDFHESFMYCNGFISTIDPNGIAQIRYDPNKWKLEFNVDFPGY